MSLVFRDNKPHTEYEIKKKEKIHNKILYDPDHLTLVDSLYYSMYGPPRLPRWQAKWTDYLLWILWLFSRNTEKKYTFKNNFWNIKNTSIIPTWDDCYLCYNNSNWMKIYHLMRYYKLFVNSKMNFIKYWKNNESKSNELDYLNVHIGD